MKIGLNFSNLIEDIKKNDFIKSKEIIKNIKDINIRFPYKDDFDHPNNAMSFKNRKDNYITLLMLASQFNYIKIVKELLKYDIDLEIEDDFGSTILNRTTHKYGSDSHNPLVQKPLGSINIFKSLLKSGSKINTQDLNGNSPLINCSEHNQLKMTNELISANADLDIVNNRGNTALITIAYYHDLYDSKSKSRLEIIKELIREGANLNIKNNDGEDFFSFLSRKVKKIITSEFPEEMALYHDTKKYNL